MKTPITRERIRQHMLYNSWKYIISILAIVIGWNLIFTTTAYRSPANKIVNIYTYSVGYIDDLSAYLNHIHETEMQDMEQMEVMQIFADETYGSMVLMTRVAAGEGNLFILPKSEFQSYAGQGLFQQLDTPDNQLGIFEEYGINLERGLHRNTETNERHLYGIPLSCLTGLKEMIHVNSEYFLCVKEGNGNEDNTMKLFNRIIQDCIRKPEAQPSETTK